jgi:hypothetical protein
MRPPSRCQHRVEVLRLLLRCRSRRRGVNAAVEVSRPAHVLVLLLKSAFEAEAEVVEVEASRPRHNYQ